MMLDLQSSFIHPTIDDEEVIFSVSDLVSSAHSILQQNFPSIWLEGELSNFSAPRSGHWYFQLKDPHAQIRVAMFKGQNNHVNFTPEDGQQVLIQGKVGIYATRGDFQFVANQMLLAGSGALQLAFEQLKAKLQAEGLFDQKHKKLLPEYPSIIGVVTSATGAAISDVLSVLQRRYPIAKIIIYPTLVQGNQAAKHIVRAIEIANQRHECDVLLVTRGGGSIEDLWPFNEEIVARAIFNSTLPIISAVGHEIDFTISDFVADVRAPTPSAAAELVSPAITQLLAMIADIRQSLIQVMQYQLADYAKQLTIIRHRIKHPNQQLQAFHKQLHYLLKRLIICMRHRIVFAYQQLQFLQQRLLRNNLAMQTEKQVNTLEKIHQQINKAMQLKLIQMENQLRFLSRALHSVSPLTVLDRGYSITTNKDGNIITNSQQVTVHDNITVQLALGKLQCQVMERHKN